jgi:threonine dehydratase
MHPSQVANSPNTVAYLNDIGQLASKVVQDVKTADGQDIQLKLSLKAENLQRIGAFKVSTGKVTLSTHS